MNCNEAGELIGAYALDALPPDEAAAMRAHLATCATHAAAAAELLAVAARLPALAEETTPPAALRSRLLAAIAAEPRARDSVVRAMPAARSAAPAAAKTATAQRPRSLPSIRLQPYAWGSIAAIFVAAIAGLLVWNIVLQTRGSTGDASRLASHLERSVPLRSNAGAQGGVVVFFPDERKAVVVGEGLPSLDAGKTYQMWQISGQRPVSLGLIRPDGAGHSTAIVPYDPDRPSTLAITIEPAGGSAEPTTAPILTTSPAPSA